jgi:opacity protein-like surface antigen
LEIRLVVTGPVNYESFTLFNPNRLVIDLLQVREFRNPAEVNVNDSGVSRIRTAKNQPDVVRVVFDLDDTVPSYSIEDRQGTIHIFFRSEQAAGRQPETKPAQEPVTTDPQREAPPVTPPQAAMQSTPQTQPGVGDRGNALSLNLGGGVYMPQSTDFQDVYGKSAMALGLGVTYYIPLSGVEDLGFSLDGNYISDTGATTATAEEVKLTLMPVMLSAFYQRHFGNVIPYVGVGGSLFSYKETLPETFAVPEVTGTVIGFNFLLGTHVKVMPQLSLRAYFRYHVAKKTDADGFEINLTGSELGLGLSYFFDL